MIMIEISYLRYRRIFLFLWHSQSNGVIGLRWKKNTKTLLPEFSHRSNIEHSIQSNPVWSWNIKTIKNHSFMSSSTVEHKNTKKQKHLIAIISFVASVQSTHSLFNVNEWRHANYSFSTEFQDMKWVCVFN